MVRMTSWSSAACFIPSINWTQRLSLLFSMITWICRSFAVFPLSQIMKPVTAMIITTRISTNAGKSLLFFILHLP